jgi:hypothetical protein
MLNRRTFLGAAVAATILPAGDALAAKPASGHVPSDRTIEAHETPDGVLYTVRDGERETTVVRRPGTYEHLDYDAIDRDVFAGTPYALRTFYSPPAPFEYTIVSRSSEDERAIPQGSLVPGWSCGFLRPPSLEDVVTFHEACCADVPGRVIDALVTPVANFWRVDGPGRYTSLLGGRIESIDTRTAGHPRTSVPSGMCPLSEVLAFHEQCCAEDGAAAPRG